MGVCGRWNVKRFFSTQFFGEVLSRFTYFTSRVLNLSKLYLDLSHSLLRLLLGVTQSEKQVPCLYPGGENCRSVLSENFQMSNEAKSCGEFATTQNVVMSALHHNASRQHRWRKMRAKSIWDVDDNARPVLKMLVPLNIKEIDSRSLPRLFVLFSLLLCFSYSFPSCSSFCFRLG